ncbi:MAG: phosphate acetyltransferase [Candidatus Cloacimonetes bacterium]|nr:phosphate acetyltransferase [Candidatus Cloacimonadota bacterium]
MSILDTLKDKAKWLNRAIVLPETGDERTLRAAAEIINTGLARVILIGDLDEIRHNAGRLGLDLGAAQVVSVRDYPHSAEFVEDLFKRRSQKGLTMPEARQALGNPLYLGAYLVKNGIADGMVAGAVNTTADVLRAALHVVGVKRGLKTVSSSFIMVIPEFMGQEAIFSFADCAVIPDPTAEQLADIAIGTAQTRRQILGDEPRVALLSFSTRGSASHELINKVLMAKAILEERKVDFAFDGELQLDAAIIPDVARRKAQGSTLAGTANTLIFPDLQSGNIGYKLVQRFAKAEAIGPIIQGLASPIGDLSRGCSWQDIVATTALVILKTKKE